MINELVKEINQSLDNGCVMAGLSLALTLPDICGKAFYPNLKPRERYIKWFDEYIGQYEHDEEHIRIGMPYLSGDLVYSLRNSILHQGNPNIDGKKFGIIYFELLYWKFKGWTFVSGSSEAEIIKDENGNDKAINKKMTVNVRDLCWKICRLAEICYKKEKAKFNFFNYNLVNTDFSTKRTFGFDEGGQE